MPNLVLSRRKNESIRIGDEIEITIVQCGSQRVRVAIQAPEHLLVLRGELSPRDTANASDRKIDQAAA